MKQQFQGDAAWLLAGDFFFLVASLYLALFFRGLEAPEGFVFATHVLAFMPIFLVSLGIFYVAGLYEKQTRLVRTLMTSRIFGAQLGSVLLAAFLFFLLPLSIAPKTVLALYLGLSVILVSAWRFVAIPRFTAKLQQPALLIGEGEAVNELAQELAHNPRYRIAIQKQVSSAQARTEAAASYARGVRLFVVDVHDVEVQEALPELYSFSGATFLEFRTLYEEVFDRVPLAHIDATWILEHTPKPHAFYDAAKRLFDIVGAVIGLILVSPIIAVSALLLLPSGSPFLSHERVGKGGRTFRIIKLRSMLFDDHGVPERQKKNRVTMLGAFLRRTRIDELPQLLNIIIGDLSFIGPRPELPRIAAVYERDIPFYQARHLITPGLSGWAQIWHHDAPRGGADVERTKRKLSYDLYYLSRRSFALDISIALKTLRTLASFSGK
jgi:lipopolysaccharide/colanic/teichoic acid biosynthesis glycosyltransferase